MLEPTSNVRRFSRYALVGAASNALLYVGFLALCRAGLDPKAAMTCMYATGVALTFTFNRRWTFGDYRAQRTAFLRYCAAYGLGYLANLAALWALVDLLRWPHEAVQAVLIALLAVTLFLVQKHWVFRPALPV